MVSRSGLCLIEKIGGGNHCDSSPPHDWLWLFGRGRNIDHRRAIRPLANRDLKFESCVAD
jgi:hypothetical protein